MQHRTLGLAFLLALGLTACSSDDDGSPVPSDEHQLSAADIADIEALADDAVAAGIPGVSLAIIRGTQTVTIARGTADASTGRALTTNDHFRMASQAKSYTASAILGLVNEGRLSLADTVGQWLPGALPASSDVTIERLLRLESGIFDFSADDRYVANLVSGELGHAYTPAELVGYASEHEPLFAPGERFNYSNTNYVALALIAEKLTGKTLPALVEERITRPLGLREASLATGTELPEPFAHGYMLGFGDPLDATGLNGAAVYGCGNLVSTPLDSARFYGALVKGRVVARSQLPAMFSQSPGIETHYGMGVHHWDHDPHFLSCGEFVGHDGGIPGYDSVAYSSVDGTRQFSIVATLFTVDEKVGDAAAQQAFGALVNAIGCR